jgi:ribonuclease HI
MGIQLFIDGSVNTKSKIGFGAYLLVSEEGVLLEDMKPLVRVKRFEHTSSTKLELQTLLWALGEIQAQVKGSKISVYTDSQNIIGLLGRRERLVQNNYISKSNKLVNHHDLYKEFFRVVDLINCELVKVKGHLVSKEKDNVDRLFTLVDRASRNALRNNHST